MKKSLIHKILVYSLSFIFVLEICFANASIVHANDNGDQVIDESVDLSEGQLENVTNLHWVEGSAATISWDAADGANYYDILVTVYDVNSSYMGSSTTGTSSLEIDVQQEIYNAINNSSLAINSDYARVIVTVYSMKTLDGEILEKSNGIDSSVLVYGYKIYQLPDAYDLVLTEDYVAQFKCDISNPNEAINNYFLEIYYSSGESYCCNLSTNQVACENGLFSVGIKEYIEEGYQQYGIDGIINVSYRIAMAGTLYYLDSGDRYFSNNVSFGKESTKTIQLPTATNLVLSDNYLLSCEYDSTIPYDAVRKVSLELKFIDENEECWEFGQEFEASFPFNCEEGICCGNIERFIKEACVQFKLEGEVDVAARVMMVGTENYYDSTPSEYSNYIKYQVGSIRLPSATDVVLTDDYIAEFKCSIPNSDEIIKEVYISYAHVGKVNYGRRYRDLQWEGDTCRVDILDALKEGYLKYNLEGETEVIYRVEFTGSEGYYDSDPSEYSNAVPFYGILKVDAINLYPSKPILCNEHSYYLGKTITPENAYYNEIEWTSDNPSVVTVEDDGEITGISTGEANITAQIGDATDTVTVTVYDISSNIEDETDNQEVTDTAGDIIDDIVNNDNPDLSNTDINPEDLEEIKEEIQEAIDNGDAFHTDIKYIQEYFEKYKKNWGQIQKAAGNLNAQFEGAYNIEVEMYHKDKDDVEHHIGNITELENEVTFTFDLPTGMKEQQSGETKKYVLVRIHKNKDGETEYTPVDYTINDDGTFTAKSSEYSDFVWVGIDSLDEIINVENIGWEKESTLTLCWDKVGAADYYQIEAMVYYEDWQGEDILYDNIFTETSDISIDLQQEIRTLVGEEFFDNASSNGHYVKVQCKVSAYVNLDNGNNKMIAESSYSDKKVFFINYSYDDIELDAPQNLVLNPDTLELTFDKVDNATGYSIEILIPKSGNICNNGSIIKENGDGTLKTDVSDTLRRMCTNEYISLIRSGEREYRNSPIEVCATVTAYYKNYAAKRSEESKSNIVDYYINLIELDKPQNLIIDQETMMLSFDCVEGATQYEVYVGNEEMGCYLSSGYENNGIEEGRLKVNIESLVNSFTTSYGKTNEANEIFVEVEAFAYDEKAMCTAWSYGRSERSNKVTYYNKTIDLVTPQNVVLDPDTFVISFDRVDGATFYYIMIYNKPNGEGVGDRYYQKGQGTERIEYDIEDIVTMYKRSDELGSNGVFARVSAVAFENDDINALQIGASGWADSNYVADSKTEVESIEVSPRNPICYVGKTRPLGKTINPVNAYYENIKWSSDNDNIVSIDEIGKITGKSVGTANITAKIGETSDTVLVTVYDIISNIEDDSENQEVTDTAGDIIDDIVNNDNPDLSNTDINPEDVDQIKEEIQEAIDNGDAFHTDIKYIQEYFEKYKKNWGQIQKAAGNLNAQFEGAYNIEVEMYHKDKDDVEHHIGNITELENEVTFTFDLPTGMKEQQSGETKKYVLVRIHKNKDGETEFTPVDYTINDDGTFTAKSSEYSDFVWVGIEESSSEDDCSILGHKWDDGKVTKEATETTEGIMAYTCERCGETYTESIPKKEHEHNLKYTDAIEATCTEEGNYEYWYCDKCGKYYSDKDATNKIEENSYIISATGHKYDQKNYAKYLKSAATCTEKAVYYYSCGECGSVDYNHTFTSGNTLGHDWDEGIVTQETTETSEGIITYVCKRCNESHTESIPIKVHKHNLKQVNAQDATCTKEGNFEYWYCDKCGNYFSDKNASKQIVKDSYIIQAKGHKNNNKNTNSKYLKSVANCTKPAEYYYSCNECGEIDYDHTFTSGDALGHKWNEGKVTQEATETSEGIMTYTCERCGETYTESIPKKEHEHNLKHTEAIEATCTEEGHYEYWYCDKCGKYYSDMDATNEIEEDSYIISATGHNYDQKRNYAQYLKSIATCTEKAVYYYSCSVCGEADHNHTFTSGNTLGHDWDEGKVTQEATENAEGIKTFTCSVCGETYTETIPKLNPLVIDPVKAFVTRFYTTILQRKTINDEEIEYYTSRLKSGELDGCSVAKGFIMSPEYTGKGEDDSTFVNKMYAAFFNREADDAAFYINLLESGYSREVVLAGFVNSPEFKALCAEYGINPGELIIDPQNNNQGNNGENGNNQGNPSDDVTKLNLDTTNVDPDKLDAYVKNLYIQILGRQYDEGGLQYWKEQIMAGTTYDAATAARVGFFESPEYKNMNKTSEQFVTDCYHAFLGRDPEPDGLSYWMNKLDSGEYSKQKVIDLGFGHSEEFKGILTNCGFRIIE